MGGRGSKSGGIGTGGGVAGLTVDFNGEKTTYFFNAKGGVNYYTNGMGGMPQQIPNNMTPKEFKDRIESNGAKTSVIGAKERKKLEEEHKKQRKEVEKDLDISWFKAAPRPRKGMRGH